jgi:8-oxo-dGTP pyrophosphatase MutT (NUDIX family)
VGAVLNHRPGGAQRIPRPATWTAGELDPPAAHPLTRSVTEVVSVLAGSSPGRSPAPAFPGARPSAVLVALADGPRGVEVLLTRRSMDLRHHRGEVSFPGGRIDPGETPVKAATREAHEEVGLDRHAVTIVGELDHLSTVVSLSYIVPVVGVLAAPLALRPTSLEVERVFWLPLAELVRPDTYRSERWGQPPTDRLLHFFELDDETIWGATATVLVDLLGRL